MAPKTAEKKTLNGIAEMSRKIVLWTHKFAVGLIVMGGSESPGPISPKGLLHGKLTWESDNLNLIILCLLIVLGMTFIFMVHLNFYAIPLLIYDVMYDITTISQGTQL